MDTHSDRNDDRSGFIRILIDADGTAIDEFQLPSPPIVDGLAATSGQIYESTRAGKLIWLSE